jgi:hypothetical protein
MASELSLHPHDGDHLRRVVDLIGDPVVCCDPHGLTAGTQEEELVHVDHVIGTAGMIYWPPDRVAILRSPTSLSGVSAAKGENG